MTALGLLFPFLATLIGGLSLGLQRCDEHFGVFKFFPRLFQVSLKLNVLRDSQIRGQFFMLQSRDLLFERIFSSLKVLLEFCDCLQMTTLFFIYKRIQFFVGFRDLAGFLSLL